MSTRLKFLSSSVGTKLLIALTGLAMFIFLIAHLAGNLLIFVGPAAFNEYSHKLISNPLVYVAEAGLVLILLVHVFETVTNWASNRAARPQAYAVKEPTGSPRSRKTLASTTMIYSGVFVFVFTVLHLKTFKFGAWYETAEGHRDLYRLVVEIFANPAYVVFYVISMAIIFLHLRHGISSAFQSLGVDHPRWARNIVRTGMVLALLIGAGFGIIPLVIFLAGGRS